MDNDLSNEETQEFEKRLKFFPYFDTWNQKTIADCYRLSKTRVIPPDNIVFGSDENELSRVYFIVDGTCKLIQHVLLVPKTTPDGGTTYSSFHDNKQYNRERSKDEPEFSSLLFNMNRNLETETQFLKNVMEKKMEDLEDVHAESQIDSGSDVVKSVSKEKIEKEAFSDKRKYWKFYSRLLPYLTSRNKAETYKSADIESHFIQIALITKGGCIGVGENLQNRFLLSATEVTCLVVPLQFLLQHNPNNIWNRIKQFLNCYLPSEEKIVRQFLINRRWDEYKRWISSSRGVRSSAKDKDVPKSIRLDDPSLYLKLKAGFLI